MVVQIKSEKRENRTSFWDNLYRKRSIPSFFPSVQLLWRSCPHKATPEDETPLETNAVSPFGVPPVCLLIIRPGHENSGVDRKRDHSSRKEKNLACLHDAGPAVVTQEKNRGIAWTRRMVFFVRRVHLRESIDLLLEPLQQRMTVVQVPLDLVRGLRLLGGSREKLLLHRRRSSEGEHRGVALEIMNEREVWEEIFPGTRERHQCVLSASSEHSTPRHIYPLSPCLDLARERQQVASLAQEARQIARQIIKATLDPQVDMTTLQSQFY